VPALTPNGAASVRTDPVSIPTPMFVTAKVFDPGVTPIPTWPKLTLSGSACVPATACPTSVTLVLGCSGSVLAMSRVPVALPTMVGANWIVTVVLCSGAITNGPNPESTA